MQTYMAKSMKAKKFLEMLQPCGLDINNSDALSGASMLTRTVQFISGQTDHVSSQFPSVSTDACSFSQSVILSRYTLFLWLGRALVECLLGK